MSQILHLNPTLFKRLNISIFLVWLFHISGMIGISIGFEDWFISKTPINLSVIFVLLILNIPNKSRNLFLGLSIFFIGGMLVEWLGVHYGFLFGEYEYGDHLGPKISGVPWFIGINWAVLTLITASLATSFFKNKIFRIITGASLMVFLDFFLEFSAPIFDFWAFKTGTAPLNNYLAWFGVSVLFQLIYQLLKIRSSEKFSLHLYIAQLVFFTYFYGFYNL